MKAPLSWSMSEKTFGIGLIGLNHGIRSILPALVRSSRVNSISLAGSKLSIGKKISSPNYEFIAKSAEEVLESRDVEILFIATPPATHLAFVTDALRLGKFVYCEKPGGLKSIDTFRITQLSNISKIPVAIGYEYRFDPYIILLRKLLNEIDTSKLLTVQIDWETNGAFSIFRQKWKQQEGEGGEVARDFLPHVVDYLAQCFPELIGQNLAAELEVESADINYDQMLVKFQIRNVHFQIRIVRNSLSPMGHRIHVVGLGIEIEVHRKPPYSLDSGHLRLNRIPIDIRNSKEIFHQLREIESEITFENDLQKYATGTLVEGFLVSCISGDFSGIPTAYDSLKYMELVDFLVSKNETNRGNSKC